MTITQAFAKYMDEVLSLGERGVDLFIGSVPKRAPAKSWWVVYRGGNSILKNQTGEKKKNYILNVYHRDINSEDVDNTLQAFEEVINSKQCDQLDSFDTIEMEATGFQSDQDLDSEDRTVGLVEVTVTVYQSN